jgi:hypothetical protein
MKKQLLIAAVAATMTSVAFADISLTGSMKVNYKNTDANSVTTNTVTQEGDLVLTGTNGDTKVHMEVSVDGGTGVTATQGSMNTEDLWLSTKIGDVAIKTGTWNAGDTIFTGNATRTSGNWILSSAVSGVNVALEGDTGASAIKTTLSGDIAGVSTKFSMKGADANGKTSNELFLSSDVAGFGVTYAMIDSKATTADAAAFTIAKEFNGVTVSYSDVDADTSYTIAGDTAAFGDAAAIGMKAGDDATAIKLSTSLAGNTVSARFVSVDIDSNDVTGDQDADYDVNTYTVTRPLANGTTLEVTYTDTDKTGATNDTEVLDVELAVKF